MTLVRWKEDYSIGAELVDSEHKALIARINRLYDQLITNDDPPAVSFFFEELINALTTHFALEERLMRDRGYVQLPQHKEDNERLLDEIRSLIDEFDPDDLAARLDGWFSNHFETHDARIEKVLDPHSK